MGLGPNWYQIRNRTYYIQKVSKFYVEKVSSFACKYVFHRPEHNAKKGLHETDF